MTHTVDSPVIGTVWKIEVAIGDTVARGDEVIILESMKMEIPVEIETDGKVVAINVEEGDAVTEGDALLTLSSES